MNAFTPKNFYAINLYITIISYSKLFINYPLLYNTLHCKPFFFLFQKAQHVFKLRGRIVEQLKAWTTQTAQILIPILLTTLDPLFNFPVPYGTGTDNNRTYLVLYKY